ncbi:hypothetical protein S122051_2210 [Staphylococcus aureus subsp. aureus 122051]|nr:hypothetical protein S122051_2210 [Staphylococcus aureus subsp. aureus 122051]
MSEHIGLCKAVTLHTYKPHFNNVKFNQLTLLLAGFYYLSIFKWLSPLLYLIRQSLLSIQLIHSYTIIYVHFYIDSHINCLYLFNLTQIYHPTTSTLSFKLFTSIKKKI